MVQPEDDIPEVNPDPDPDQMLGRVIGGNFRLESLLGTGGMGNVYRAEQISLGKWVAVKILHRDLMADTTVVKRFEREARSASRLDHANLVQIIDYGQDPDSRVLYIAMELLSGRDLAQVISEDGPLPLPRIARIMSQILAALEEAHLQGVIHRDLKPANIMLIDRRGELDTVKVCDFGIAKSTALRTTGDSMLTVRGFVCGTPEYMAPEQARGEEVDGRTDLYAAAVILYQLITGEVPFTASSPVGILSQHLDRAPRPPSVRRADLPPGLDALILRGLAKNPFDRPQSAGVFRQDLETVCAVEPAAPLVARGATARTLSVPAVSLMHPSELPPRAPGASASKGLTWATTLALAAVVAVVVFVKVWTAFVPSPPAVTSIAPSVVPEAASLAGVGTTRSPRPSPGLPARGPAPAVPAPAPAVVAATTLPPPSTLAGPAPGGRAGGAHPAAEATGNGAPVASARARQRARAPSTRLAMARPGAGITSPGRAGPAAVAAGATAAMVPGLAPAPEVPPPPPPLTPSQRAREILVDAERLLAQGEIGQACARGEEARHVGARSAAIYRFLGKCYMRAGNAERASDHYRSYLELAPNASDAAFIKSIVK